MQKKIKIKLIEKGITITDLANRLNCTPQNISGKLRRNNFTTKDLEEIAKAIGCKLEINFIDID